jgi:hypothetical protein
LPVLERKEEGGGGKSASVCMDVNENEGDEDDIDVDAGTGAELARGREGKKDASESCGLLTVA